MSTETRCSHCGAQVKIWKKVLSKGLVMILKKFAGQVIASRKNDVNITEIGLSHTEICVFQQLRYFGLVAKVKNEEGQKIASRYLLTRRGAKFLKNEEAVSIWVKTFRNRIEERSEEKAYFSDILTEHGAEFFNTSFEFDIKEL